MAESGEDASQAKRSGTELFAYHRQLAPMLWALVAVGIVELGVVHLLLWHWSPVLTLILGAASAAAILCLVALILSFRARPVVLGETSLRVRAGYLVDADIPLSEIAFAQSGFTPADYMPGALLKASLLAYPNAVILLRRDIDLPGPFGRVRTVHAVAVAVDEPARFLQAMGARVKHGAAPGEPSLAAA
jgi:hypothetical protein